MRLTAPCRDGETRSGGERIEKHLPFPMLGFDCDNGSEFLNEILEAYLLKRKRSIIWTRSRAYKKNDQARVEQEENKAVFSWNQLNTEDHAMLAAVVARFRKDNLESPPLTGVYMEGDRSRGHRRSLLQKSWSGLRQNINMIFQ